VSKLTASQGKLVETQGQDATLLLKSVLRCIVQAFMLGEETPLVEYFRYWFFQTAGGMYHLLPHSTLLLKKGNHYPGDI